MTVQNSMSQGLKAAFSIVTNLNNSIAYGKSGEYMLGPIPVKFEERGPFFDGIFNTLKNIGNIVNVRFSYVLAHEMGHAIAAKVLTGQSTPIIIFNAESGACRRVQNCSDRDEKIILAAGPLTGALYACIQFYRAASYFTSSRSMSIFLSCGAFVQMLADYEYLISSGLSKDDGDWGKLRKKGPKSLFLAASAMTALYTLGLYLAFKRLSAK